MDIKQLDEEAIKRAERELKKGFNVQAYIVYKLNNMSNPSYEASSLDLVPDSDIDENIQAMLKNYIEYSNFKKEYRELSSQKTKSEMLKSLENTLNNYVDIINSLWTCTDCDEERNKIEEFVAKIQS
jgi:predicted lactoylglutathione lyase